MTTQTALLVADTWADLGEQILKSVGFELIVFVVTLGVALVVRNYRYPDGRPKCEGKAHELPSMLHANYTEAKDRSPLSAAPRRTGLRKTATEGGRIINEIIEGMREQQNIRFAHRALHLYEELRAAMLRDNMMLKEVTQHSKYDAVELYTMMVNCAVRAGRHHVIEAVLEDMVSQDVPRSMQFYECSMKQLAGQKQYSLALKMYESMDKDGLTPSAVTCSCLISFAAEVGELQRAVGFFDRLASMTTPSIRAYMTVLRVHAKCQDWNASLETLRAMTRLGVKPDSLALNVVLATGIASDRIEAVSDLLEEVESSPGAGKTVDIVSYNTLIKGYAQHGDAESAVKAIDRLCKRGLTPNAITFNTAMDGAVRGCRFEDAWLLLEKMNGAGLRGDKFSCSILVKGLGKCMKDNTPGRVMCERISSALALLGQVDSQLDNSLRSSLYHSVLEYAVQVPIHSGELAAKVFAQMRLYQVSVSVTGQRLLVQALPKAGGGN